METTPLRLAFIGLGGMGQVAHLRNYLLDPGVRVTCAAELRPDLAAMVAARYGIPRIYPDHRALLEAETLDAIVAIQPFSRHGQLLPDLLDPKVPILIEKPLARSAEIGDELAAVAEAAGVPIYVAYHKRSDPAVMRARQTVTEWKASGEFGALRHVRLTMPPGPWPSPRSGFEGLLKTDEPYPTLIPDPDRTGLGEADRKRLDAFVNYYIHQVNLMRHLFGEEYEVAYSDPSERLLVARSVSGATGILEMAPYASRHEWQEQALVAFERAWIRVDIPGPLAVDAAGRVTLFRDRAEGAETVSPVLPSIHAMRQQAIHFAAAVRGQPTPLCTAAEAARDLRLARTHILALAAAAAAG